jgi:transcriptional regulator with XRE-family HTH domain
MSQETLAKVARTGRATIAHIETGKTQWLRPDVMGRLARALGVTEQELLHEPAAEALAVGPAAPHVPLYLKEYGSQDKPTRDELDYVRGMKGDTVWIHVEPSADSIRTVILARRGTAKGHGPGPSDARE